MPRQMKRIVIGKTRKVRGRKSIREDCQGSENNGERPVVEVSAGAGHDHNMWKEYSSASAQGYIE